MGYFQPGAKTIRTSERLQSTADAGHDDRRLPKQPPINPLRSVSGEGQENLTFPSIVEAPPAQLRPACTRKHVPFFTDLSKV